jgi:hydroxypyruvate isomerase
MNDAALWDRRTMAKAVGVGAAAALGVQLGDERSRPLRAAEATAGVKGNIKQSVCRWCYGDIPLEKLAAEAKRMGYQSIELVTPEEFPTVKAAGLTCAMLSGACRIEDCFNRTENHEQLEAALREHIEFAAANGLPSVICFSGNRGGMSDDEGLDNCAVGLKRIVGFAEEKEVTICMELLNSKVNHADYMCDHTAWGVELVERVGSPRFKLLYDIYHMQIMEGDVIRTLRDHKDAIGHYHTGGNPGRNEIDETQELNYPAIVQAIVDTGYDGYLGQEFIPTRDPLASLEQGFLICDV